MISWRKGIGVLVGAGLILTLSVSAKPRKMQRIATGLWGGPHISINVGAKSATIEYDCANGVIDGPLVVDSKGRFNWRGTHTLERGGPVRSDDVPVRHPAIYTGQVKGNTMTLTVKLADQGEPLDTFTLEKGKPGKIFKCM